MSSIAATTAMERSEIDGRLHPWIRALEGFGVPFMAYGADGRRTYASPAVALFLRDDTSGLAIIRQADLAVAAELSCSASRLHIGAFVLVREIPISATGVVLGVHLASTAQGNVSAVVVFRPVMPVHSDKYALPGLSRREREVARLIAAGLATKEIAMRLGISCHTTRHHTEAVFAKLSVRSRSAVAAVLGGRFSAYRN